MMRHRLLAVSTALAALAAAAPPSHAEKPRAFVEETRIAAPRRIGQFALDGTYFDEKQKFAGASLRYALASHPEVRFDLFFYPAGELPEDKAMTSGMEGFKTSLDRGAQAGLFRNVDIVDKTPFELALPQPEDQKAPKPGPLHGQRLELRYEMHLEDTGQYVPIHSHGYLFFNDLYYIKGRFSAADSRIDAASFDALADQAIRELVPAIVISNVGACANVTITIDKSRLDKGLTIEDLLAGMNGLDAPVRNRCFDSRDQAKRTEPDDAEIVTIAYDAKDWGDPE